MQIPFLNRKRYIVLRCYTWHAGVLEQAPISMSTQPMRQHKADFMDDIRDFSGCWSRVQSQKISATVPCPTEIKFQAKGDGLVNSLVSSNAVEVDFQHDDDPNYAKKDMVLSKIVLPWRCVEDTGVNFIMARHMQCKVQLNILSGVVAKMFPLNIFNLTNIQEHKFNVPPKEPLVSLYPMSDLPMHIEAAHDPDKFSELVDRDYMFHFRATGLKR